MKGRHKGKRPARLGKRKLIGTYPRPQPCDCGSTTLAAYRVAGLGYVSLCEACGGFYGRASRKVFEKCALLIAARQRGD